MVNKRLNIQRYYIYRDSYRKKQTNFKLIKRLEGDLYTFPSIYRNDEISQRQQWTIQEWWNVVEMRGGVISTIHFYSRLLNGIFWSSFEKRRDFQAAGSAV